MNNWPVIKPLLSQEEFSGNLNNDISWTDENLSRSSLKVEVTS